MNGAAVHVLSRVDYKCKEVENILSSKIEHCDWLGSLLRSSRYNHCAVIITMKASSFQNGSQIC